MKQVEKYLWRYRWAGRSVTSSFHMTEEEVRKAHPEAVKVPGSMKVFEVLETEEERRAAWKATDTSAVGKPR